MKIVITGGPCSGKTTILNGLQQKGYLIINESAREIILEKNYSKYLDRYKGEALDLQLDIHERQITKEKKIDGLDNIVFLDRGHIDNHVYCQHFLGYVPEKIQNADVNRYDAIIVLDRIPLIDDGLRRENDAEAERLHRDIIQAYKNQGYNPIIIPVTTVEDRIRKVERIAKSFEKKSESIESTLESVLKYVEG